MILDGRLGFWKYLRVLSTAYNININATLNSANLAKLAT